MKKWICVCAMLLSASALAEGEPGSAFAVDGAWIVGLVIVAAVIALIVVSCMIGKLKRAHKQDNAGSYVRKGSFNLRVKQDRFLYQTVQRRKIEREQKKEG